MLPETQSFSAKMKIFNAVLRTVMCYGSQVWGLLRFYEVKNTVQRLFVKRVLGLPKNMPNYMVYFEIDLPHLFNFSLNTHLYYIKRVWYLLPKNRLPKLLNIVMVKNKCFWFKRLTELGNN